jgi:hypothetical protein
MATRTIRAVPHGRTTRNSRNASTSQIPTRIPLGRRTAISEVTPDTNPPDGTPPHDDGDGPRDDPDDHPDDHPDEHPDNQPDNNPDDPDDPDDDQGNNNDDDDDDDDDENQPNLARAITRLAKSIKQPPNHNETTKVREPETFDGNDPKKLRHFLVQLELNFNDRPRAFRTDRAKVNYAISYLKGPALDWFEPGLIAAAMRGQPRAAPDWIDDFDDFTNELVTYFGPHDPVGEAETELENLRMKDGHRITKYLTEFNRLAPTIGWGDEALRHMFYRGLPPRIKDEICRIGKPKQLRTFQVMARSIDARYWERRSELSREAGSSNTRTPNQQNSSEGKKSDKKNKSSTSNSHNNNNNNNNSNNSNKNQKSGNSGQQKPKSDLSDKLGKDGKLTSAERQRRFANNLCLFCGEAGHTAKDCTKIGSSASKSKGRAAKTDTKSDAPAEDSKKA